MKFQCLVCVVFEVCCFLSNVDSDLCLMSCFPPVWLFAPPSCAPPVSDCRVCWCFLSSIFPVFPRVFQFCFLSVGPVWLFWSWTCASFSWTSFWALLCLFTETALLHLLELILFPQTTSHSFIEQKQAFILWMEELYDEVTSWQQTDLHEQGEPLVFLLPALNEL